MTRSRLLKKVLRSKPTIEGAGVHLERVFGYYEKHETDPFLLLDHFESRTPADYISGFPWHPHRGIETVTYMLEGEVEHGDSLGNKGVIRSGDVQWMTAGSGIIHQEMPKAYSGNFRGFQLWVNLPKIHKMMPPRYREITQKDIPAVKKKDAVVKVISGEYGGARGPVGEIVMAPVYWDVALAAGGTIVFDTPGDHRVLIYIYEGKGYVGEGLADGAGKNSLVILGEGEEVRVTAKEIPVNFLFLSGKSLKEPIAWYGPVVMNTDEELTLAFREYQNGTFIK